MIREPSAFNVAPLLNRSHHLSETHSMGALHINIWLHQRNIRSYESNIHDQMSTPTDADIRPKYSPPGYCAHAHRSLISSIYLLIVFVLIIYCSPSTIYHLLSTFSVYGPVQKIVRPDAARAYIFILIYCLWFSYHYSLLPIHHLLLIHNLRFIN
jgi:hypothetical protein